jgi:glycosyltransferase involved in cell wall biosynthesis
MQKITVIIDAFRIVCEKNTSGRAYAMELVSALSQDVRVEHIYLLVPWLTGDEPKPWSNTLVSYMAPKSGYTPNPAESWIKKTYWIQFVVPALLREINLSHAWYIAPYHQCPIRSSRYRVLAVVHDLCGLQADCGYKKTKRAYWYHWLNFLSVRFAANKVVPISKHARDSLIRRYPVLKDRTVEPIYNAVTGVTLQPSQAAERINELGLSSGEYFLAFAAPGPRKGTDVSLQAFSIYKAAAGSKKLVIIGGSAGISEWKRWNDSGLKVNAVWLSGVSNEVRDSLYSGAVALLFPSRCEGFGYPIIEAMRQGCPSIAKEDSPAKEISPQGLTMLSELDANELCKIMQEWEAYEKENGSNSLRTVLIDHSMKFANNTLADEFLAAMIA